jgi:hypothetical protein
VAQGSRARITELVVHLFESVGMSVGKDEESAILVDFRTPSDLMNEGVPLFTGDKSIRLIHGWSDGATIHIRNDQPTPLTVLGYTAKVEVSGAV